MSTTDEDRLRLLSDAERAAMEGDDYDPNEDNEAALAEIGRGNLDNGEEEEGEGRQPGDGAPAPKDPPAADVSPADPAEGAPDPAADPAPAAKDAPATQEPPAPQGYQVELPTDYDDQVKANKEAVRALRQKFSDGELDQAEYDAQLDELQDQRDELRDLKTRATVAAEMRQQSEKDAWVNTINTFVADAAKTPELGLVDYAKDTAKQADLDTFVKALASAKGNENKPMRWFLEEAHKRVVALHGIPTTKKAAGPAAGRTPDASAVVTNLADVPGGAGDADPVSDEFAELDKLTGLDYERELARLSPEKRDRYLRA